MGKFYGFLILGFLLPASATLMAAPRTTLTAKQYTETTDKYGPYRLVGNFKIGFLSGQTVSAHFTEKKGCTLTFADMQNASLKEKEILNLSNPTSQLENEETCLEKREVPGGDDYCEKVGEPITYSVYQVDFVSWFTSRKGNIICREISTDVHAAAQTFSQEMEPHFILETDN